MASSIKDIIPEEETKITKPMNTCVICCEELNNASATTKCGHTFCTECLLNSVAKNYGTEEGSTRNKCPLCREEICDKVIPDASILIHMKDIKDQLFESNKQIKQMDDTYIHTVREFRKEKINFIDRLDKCRLERNTFKTRSETQFSKITKLLLNCSLVESKSNQYLEKIRKLEEELEIAQFTSEIRNKKITNLRAQIPKESSNVFSPVFKSSQTRNLFSEKKNDSPIFTFGDNSSPPPTKFTFG